MFSNIVSSLIKDLSKMRISLFGDRFIEFKITELFDYRFYFGKFDKFFKIFIFVNILNFSHNFRRGSFKDAFNERYNINIVFKIFLGFLFKEFRKFVNGVFNNEKLINIINKCNFKTFIGRVNRVFSKINDNFSVKFTFLIFSLKFYNTFL